MRFLEDVVLWYEESYEDVGDGADIFWVFKGEFVGLLGRGGKRLGSQLVDNN